MAADLKEIYDVLIVGAGPAGSSAAIRIADAGRKVLLVEQKRFPREKLCGEFVSPECLEHFRELGIDPEIDLVNPSPIIETVFYSRRGKALRIDNRWLGGSEENAIGLSRAKLDQLLIERASESGVDILQETTAMPILKSGRLDAVRLRSPDGLSETVKTVITIDATGRGRALSRSFTGSRNQKRADYVAFKAHLRGARVENGACEIYVYPGGYGGCARIENGLYNLCFIVKASQVKQLNSDPNRIWREVILKNKRAVETLRPAAVDGEWLAVPITQLGRGSAVPADGLLAVGDAASFIDPFTGSGILIALETAKLAGDAITQHSDFNEIARAYRHSYNAAFKRRLFVSSLIRQAGKANRLADAAIALLGSSKALGKIASQATRSGSALKTKT